MTLLMIGYHSQVTVGVLTRVQVIVVQAATGGVDQMVKGVDGDAGFADAVRVVKEVGYLFFPPITDGFSDYSHAQVCRVAEDLRLQIPSN